MFNVTPLNPVKSILFIGIAFAAWSILSIGWYVCGTNHLCNISAEAQAKTVTINLVDTQAPIAIAYDRAGVAGEIFVMLMIAFTLGALLGRILAAPRSTEVSDERAREDTHVAPRIGTPVHISELTKTAVRAPIPMPAQSVPAPVAKVSPSPVAKPVIHLGGATPQKSSFASKAPVAQSSTPSQAAASERPKVRFNTSWSNPTRPATPPQQKKA